MSFLNIDIDITEYFNTGNSGDDNNQQSNIFYKVFDPLDGSFITDDVLITVKYRSFI